MTSKQNYIIWGAAGHCLVLSDIIKDSGAILSAIFDERLITPTLKKVPFYHGIEGFRAWRRLCERPESVRGLVAIGGAKGRERLSIQKMLESESISVTNIYHASARIAQSVTAGQGNHFLAGCNVASYASVGNGNIFNHNSNVDHECVIGDGVHVAPGAVICGCVVIENYVFVGAGAIVMPRVRLGEGCTVGAGAVVTRSVPPHTTVAGNPAKSRVKN